MLEINFLPCFIKAYNNLEIDLKEEIKEKISLFKNIKNHKLLKVHKLHGKYKDRYSFYVNYQTRIVFKFLTKKEVVLLDVGDHDLYK